MPYQPQSQFITHIYWSVIRLLQNNFVEACCVFFLINVIIAFTVNVEPLKHKYCTLCFSPTPPITTCTRLNVTQSYLSFKHFPYHILYSVSVCAHYSLFCPSVKIAHLDLISLWHVTLPNAVFPFFMYTLSTSWVS